MGSINEYHRTVIPPVIRCSVCTRGRDTEEMGMLITGSWQEMDSGPDCNGSDGHRFMGRKASRSRRLVKQRHRSES